MRTHVTIIVLLISATVAGAQTSLLNFNHLNHLTEKIEFMGDTVSIVHVYANYPEYEWVGAKESGLEGIACVDDAARAAVVYLRHYELTKNAESLLRAKSLLKFVMKMETDDGMFYNFILSDHSINKNGPTSFKSFGWWAARGVWCMSTGYRILKTSEPAFAKELKRKVELTFPHIDSLFINYGKSRMLNGYRIPEWLLYESGTDVSSELMLGLTEYYSATKSSQVKSFIKKLANGLMMMQEGDIKTYPYGLHRSWQTMWHMWGNGQTQALAMAGKVLNDDKMIRSAEREAQGFFSRLLIEGFKKEMDVADSSKTLTYEQIAYAVRPMSVGLLRLYEATRKTEYLKMAGLSASWLFGNNVLSQTMYDTSTGRCYDGIRDSSSVNKNSGAESTIEALYTIVEVEKYPLLRNYINCKKTSHDTTPQYVYGVFRLNDRDNAVLAVDVSKNRLIISEKEHATSFLLRVRK